MSKCQDFRNEFQCKNFGFNHDSPKLFVLSECGPRLLYPVWTGFWLLWHLGWFAVDPYDAYRDGSTGNIHYFIYLTNWGYIILGFFNLVDFIATMYVHFKRVDIIHRKTDEKIEMPWYLKLSWIMFEISSTTGVLITIAYYGLLSPTGNAISVAKHGINSVYILLNLFVCAKPIRTIHVIYSVIFGVVYVLFSVIYQLGGGGAAIYTILDWDKPQTTMIYMVLTVLVGIPITHIVLFACYILRIFISDKCCKRKTDIKIAEIDMTNVDQVTSWSPRQLRLKPCLSSACIYGGFNVAPPTATFLRKTPNSQQSVMNNTDSNKMDSEVDVKIL